MTLNAWFEPRDRGPRTHALLRALSEWDADVVALQEICPPVLQQLLSADVVRDEYDITVGAVDVGYGVVLMSRIPFRSVSELRLQSLMGRTALVGDWALPDGRSIAIATVHLESTRELAASRIEQLGIVTRALDRHESAIVAGDFNFDPHDPEEQSLDPRFVDLWPTLRRGEPGYTEDTYRNPNRLWTERGNAKQARYDRVVLRGASVRAIAIEMIGAEPVESPRGPMWLSDHFGLMVDASVGAESVER